MRNICTFRSGNREIWDYRGIRFRDRIKIALSLIFTGIVSIKWGSVENRFLE